MIDYSELFIHETDRAALKALKAVPGFDTVSKKFFEVFSEKAAAIINLSSNLRINEKQMPKYYGMLVDVCKKLKMEVPDFYLELNCIPNAYTMGDTKPVIVITSALLETFPDELIPTVLAHECGHIICHHSLYNTMLTYLINGAFTFAKYTTLTEVAYDAIIIAMRYWQRCSELSADRVAVVYDGKADKMIECCMRFCGYDKDINDKFSFEEFINQASDYKKLVSDSKWNKTLEVMQVFGSTHPLNTVRASECLEWEKRDDFDKIMNLYKDKKIVDIPMMFDSNHYENSNYEEAFELFKDQGFENVVATRLTEAEKKYKDDKIVEITINGSEFKKYDWKNNTDKVEIKYFQAKTDEEIAKEHPGEHKFPNSLRKYSSKNVDDVEKELKEAGFNNIRIEEVLIKKSIFIKNRSVINVLVDKSNKVQKGDWINENTEVLIQVNVFIES